MHLRRLDAVIVVFLTPSAFTLSYPGDCDSAKLRRAANKNGCSMENGAKHHKVKKGSNVLCREIIKVIETNS